MTTPGGEDLPPPPTEVPPNVVPELAVKASKPKRLPTQRHSLGKKGQPIQLTTNHFKVGLGNTDGHFYHYSVSFTYEDGTPVDGKGIGRKVINQLKQTYASDFAVKDFAYDGEKSLFTIASLPHVKNRHTVVLEDMSSNRVAANGKGGDSPTGTEHKRLRRPFQSKTFHVEINFARKFPIRAIADALRGEESENSQEAFRVLDIILRQNASEKGFLLVRQSFFSNESTNFFDVGGGVMGCRGFHSSFRTTQSGLSLNIDVSTTMTVKPGSVIDFLCANMNVRGPHDIDWSKAKRVLKNLRIKTRPNNTEFKIVGLSELTCDEQTFELKQRNSDGQFTTTVITVYDYFVKYRNIELQVSARMPCINVGKPKRPTYFPIELCSLISLQRYTKALSSLQRASLVEKSRQKPHERMRALNEALRCSNYGADSLLHACGISIGNQFVQVDGRVLTAPKLMAGNGEGFLPRNGRWNFNNKKLFEASNVERWAVVNFSARCDTRRLIEDLIRCGQMKGLQVEQPHCIINENPSMVRSPANVRVDQMFEQLMGKLPGIPKFLLCILPERKNSDIYGPWKRKNLSDFGIVTQCIAPTKINDQYLTNVLLKINAKLGGINSLLSIEHSPSIPKVSQTPTIILGMDVSHGQPGRADVPSIAAVVSSRQWPLISKYRAAVRTQSPKVEMIDSLYKPLPNNEDSGLVRELLIDFYVSSGKRKPDQIIIFRDGVSESQFNQVLNVELDQIIEACKHLDSTWNPKFTLIVAQKNHHTKFFQHNSPDNVLPGTVVDNRICHPKNFDFYMCSHAGLIGTTRPTHYHVLYDEICFGADELQELVHSLSYVYQRSTTAISVVAPICYAHLAAAQISQFMKFDEFSETSSGHGVTAGGSIPVPELPRLNDKVSSSMFFC